MWPCGESLQLAYTNQALLTLLATVLFLVTVITSCVVFLKEKKNRNERTLIVNQICKEKLTRAKFQVAGSYKMGEIAAIFLLH